MGTLMLLNEYQRTMILRWSIDESVVLKFHATRNYTTFFSFASNLTKLLCFILSERNFQKEGTPLSQHTFHPSSTPMSFCNCFNNCKT